jgi:hypothetical protein
MRDQALIDGLLSGAGRQLEGRSLLPRRNSVDVVHAGRFAEHDRAARARDTVAEARGTHTGESQPLGHRGVACNCVSADRALDPSDRFGAGQDLERSGGRRLPFFRTRAAHAV